MSNKTRIHNEYFQPVVKKSCPCGSNSKRGAPKNQVYSWGEYHLAKYRTVDYFCEVCFASRIIPRLTSHAGNCGCTFQLLARSGYSIPSWLAMPVTECKILKDDAVVSALKQSPWEMMQVG